MEASGEATSGKDTCRVASGEATSGKPSSRETTGREDTGSNKSREWLRRARSRATGRLRVGECEIIEIRLLFLYLNLFARASFLLAWHLGRYGEFGCFINKSGR
jgi:hypothetical protein